MTISPLLLTGWAEGWISSGRPDVTVTWERSPSDRDKQATWLLMQGPAAWGQITLWDSGEMAVEAMDVNTGAVVLSEHISEGDEEVVLRNIRRLLTACEDF